MYQKWWHVLFQSFINENMHPTGIIWALTSCLYPWEISGTLLRRHLTPLPNSDIKKFPESLRPRCFWYPHSSHPAKPRGCETPLEMQVKAKASSTNRRQQSRDVTLILWLFNLSFTKHDSFRNWRFPRSRHFIIIYQLNSHALIFAKERLKGSWKSYKGIRIRFLGFRFCIAVLSWILWQ